MVCDRSIGYSRSHFTAVAALTLALGIGGNVAIFSMVDALILKPSPVVRPSELISIGTATLLSLTLLLHRDYKCHFLLLIP